MGNFTEIDKHKIYEILERNPNSQFYPLTNHQSKQLFIKYDHLVYEILKFNSCTREKVKTDHVYKMCIIGYCKGEITAFCFKNSKKPYIIFQFKNKNYESSVSLLKESYKNQLKHNGYLPISQSNLVIQSLYFDNNDCEFQFVASVSK